MKIKPSLSKAVYSVVSAMKKGSQFHGYDLLVKLSKDYPKATLETVLRIMRRCCNSLYVVVDQNGGMYEKL